MKEDLPFGFDIAEANMAFLISLKTQADDAEAKAFSLVLGSRNNCAAAFSSRKTRMRVAALKYTHREMLYPRRIPLHNSVVDKNRCTNKQNPHQPDSMRRRRVWSESERAASNTV